MASLARHNAGASGGANYVESGTVVKRKQYPRIMGLQYGILSPQDIENLAVKVIVDNTVYAKNLPKLGGPNDPALGPSDRRVRCITCRNTWFSCPGHAGVIRLPIALYHVHFLPFVYKWLQCICWNCSSSKGDPNDPRLKQPVTLNIERFHQTYETGKTRSKCAKCNLPQPKWSRSGSVISRTFTPAQLEKIQRVDPRLHELACQKFTPSHALAMLSNVSDKTVCSMGMDPAKAHPAWMIMQNLLVLPPNARPAIMAAEGSKRRGQDDMTSQTQDIIKICKTLRKAIAKTYEKGGEGGVLTPFAPAAQDGTRSDDEDDKASCSGPAADATAFAEFMVQTGHPCDITVEEAAALRFANPKAVVMPSTSQSNAIWERFPALCEKLQNSVTILYDNSGKFAPQARQRTGGAKKSLTDRFIGKQGRIRQNLVAKRTDMSARTVIKPDKYLDIDELGVPTAFAVILTVQEDVNSRNLQSLKCAVRAGHGVLGGASRILHADGQMTQLQYITDPEQRAAVDLRVGDVVERHLRDGDRVVFNRQPSLHKLSVMVHRVKLIDGLAIAVSLGVVEPYNADFDGDEMNLHVIQNMLGLAECVELMAVSRNVMNPQNNQPCLSLVQDVRVGGMLLTRRTTFLTLEQMQQCMGAIRYPLPGKNDLPPPVKTDPVTGRPLWSGKQLVSLVLPGIFIERRVRGADADVGPDDPAERYVLIENGELKYGTLCKSMLGTTAGGIVHRICTTFGSESANRFLSDFQRVVYAWLPTRGLSMGLRDCMIPASVQARIDATTAELDTRIAQLTLKAQSLCPHMTPVEIARVEAYMLTTLTSVLDYASRLVMQNLETLAGDASLAFFDMVEAGSKGNTSNVAQIAAFLGQQVVDGHRITPSATSGRTLPMFPKGALSAAARGFVMNSYLTGMQPHEYFYHMQGGREGLVATAVQTAQTGYIYRSDAKIQETNLVQWDGSVRNAQDYVIEFVAGGDCLDATRVEKVSIDALKWTDAQCEGWPRVRLLRDMLRSAVMTPLYREPSTRFLLPVNLPDELRRAAYLIRQIGAEAAREDESAQICEFVESLVQEITAYFPSEEACMALELSLRAELMPNKVRAMGLNVAILRSHIRPMVLQRVTAAIVAPGEAVGVISAQSIGEPSTQFTLDAFHQAGLVQRRMTVGVPRLKELLHASKSIATPSMVIPFLNKEIGFQQADKLARSLQFLCVDNVLHSSYVQFDPVGDNVVTPVTRTFKDFDLMVHCAEMYTTEASLDRPSPWIVRLVLNRTVLAEHHLVPEDIAREIARQITDCAFSVVYSQPNMSQWVLRVRLLAGATSELEARGLHARLRDDVLLGGVDGIRDSRAVQQSRTVVDDSTGGFKTQTDWVVDTEGSSLLKIATRDWADWRNTVTNDVLEVAKTLGIVAARAVLFAELDRVISYDGGYVDARHLKALTATMTHRGYILSVTRHGINRVDFSVLQRASYEEPVDMIIQAAVTAETDAMNGTCQAIVGGQKIPVGTGTVSLQENVEGGNRHGNGTAMRSGLTSRETLALGTAQRVHAKRVREVNVTNDGARGGTVYATPFSADAAWVQSRVEPVLAKSDVGTCLPDVVDKWSTILFGRTVSTNAFGVLEKNDDAIVDDTTKKSTDAAASTQVGNEAFRPSSPSEVFENKDAARCFKRPKK